MTGTYYFASSQCDEYYIAQTLARDFNISITDMSKQWGCGRVMSDDLPVHPFDARERDKQRPICAIVSGAPPQGHAI